jgi:hypothetical protein
VSEIITQKNNFKNNSLKVRVAIFVLAGLISFSSSTEKSEAALWPGVDPGITAGLTKIYDLIQGAMLGAAKQTAGVAINQQMDSALSSGGANGGPMFITDWDNYLVDQPKNDANVFINDYISETTAGKGSLANYEPVSATNFASKNYEGVGEGSFAYGNLMNKAAASGSVSVGGGNFMAQLAQGALALTVNQKKPQVTYQGNPSQMFAGGTMKNMSLYLSGINNPWAYNMHMQDKYQEKIENNKFVAATMGTAYQGVNGAGDKNNISNPGSLIKDMKASYQGMNVQTIVNARSLSEVITGAVSSATAKAVSIGIGSVQAKVTQKNASLNLRVGNQLNNNTNTSQFFKFVNR